MEWQPIETAPTDGTYVLTWDGSEICMANAAVYSGGRVGWYKDDFYGDMGVPTHWMPLPDPPA